MSKGVTLPPRQAGSIFLRTLRCNKARSLSQNNAWLDLQFMNGVFERRFPFLAGGMAVDVTLHIPNFSQYSEVERNHSRVSFGIFRQMPKTTNRRYNIAVLDYWSV